MRRVLITGGGTGIGRAIAHAFDDAGDAVTIAGRRAEPLAETGQGRSIAQITADITAEASVSVLFAGDPFDVVVANAGAGSPALAMITSSNPMKRLIDPAEVAATALFLASSGASSVNGHALSVSGGEL